MGICSSCLGGSRREAPSQDGDLDRILDSRQPSYGAIDDHYPATLQPDEDDVRREREALDHITSSAANQMIDVMHPSRSDLDHSLALANSHHNVPNKDQTRADTAATDDGDSEEADWLESIHSAGLDTVRVPQTGNLTMDLNLLRTG